MSKNTRNRILLTAVAALMMVAVAVGGTLAWLQDNTDPVVNTFTPSTIGVELEETKQWNGTDLGTDDWEAKFIPGVNLTKDPTVTVTTDVDAYVYVMVKVEGAWPTAGVSYEIADGWTALGDAYPNIYYRETSVNAEYPVLKNNTITVADTMTEDDMSNMYTDGVAQETTMTLQAWVMQKVSGVDADGNYTNFNAQEAFDKLGVTLN